MTGIELLEQIYKEFQEFKTLKHEIALISANLKILNNRVAQLLKTELDKPQPLQVRGTTPKEVKQLVQEIQKSQPSTPSPTVPLQQKSGALAYRKIYGYFKPNDEPTSDVLVLFYDRHNEVCASAVTDITGRWETMLLQHHKYIAKFIKDGTETNKEFEVIESEMEVTI